MSKPSDPAPSDPAPADRVLPSGADWIAAFAQRLGVEAPTPEQFEELLRLAGVAAHSSERIAAPVACWLAAMAGVSPVDALQMAEMLRTDQERGAS